MFSLKESDVSTEPNSGVLVGAWTYRSFLNNPDLRAALQELRSTSLDVAVARFGYFPDLALNFSYGIDAPQ